MVTPGTKHMAIYAEARAVDWIHCTKIERRNLTSFKVLKNFGARKYADNTEGRYNARIVQAGSFSDVG